MTRPWTCIAVGAYLLARACAQYVKMLGLGRASKKRRRAQANDGKDSGAGVSTTG